MYFILSVSASLLITTFFFKKKIIKILKCSRNDLVLLQ